MNDNMNADDPRWRKRALRAEQALATARNVAPGKGRIWKLDGVADEVGLANPCESHGAGDFKGQNWCMGCEWADDIQFLRRLVFDLHALRDTLRGNPRKDVYAKNDPDQWREKERP